MLITAPFAIYDYFDRRKETTACMLAAPIAVDFPKCARDQIHWKIYERGLKYAYEEARKEHEGIVDRNSIMVKPSKSVIITPRYDDIELIENAAEKLNKSNNTEMNLITSMDNKV